MDFSSDDESSSVVLLFIHTIVSATAATVTDEGENSTPKMQRASFNRDREAGHERLLADYFDIKPVYDEKMFKRRFRLSKELFIKIAKDLEAYHSFFRQSMDARGRRGFTTYQKCTAALRQMGYGTTSDAWDGYLRMSERTARESMYKFCKRVIEIYGKKYPRKPNLNDIQQIYEAHESKNGFPGMLSSLDFMQWEWFNCPSAWRGQYMRGDHRHPTVALEVVASQDLWIWHAFFGVAGCNNDLNVLEQSPLFNDIESGVAPHSSFEIDGVEYKYGYYLVDGIYHDYAVIIDSYSNPIGEKRKVIAKAQEAARKDIERAFGVLKKWHIIANPARAWEPKRLATVMYACIILHNMMIEEKGKAICTYIEMDNQQQEASDEQRIINYQEIRDVETHHNLKSDLVDHIYDLPMN